MRSVALLLAVSGVVAVGACSNDGAEREGGKITDAGPISVFELRPGDCLYPDDEAAGKVEDIQAVPCSDPHTHEVFAVPEHPNEGGVYPGEASIKKFADESCLEAFASYTGVDYRDSDLFFTYLHPSFDSWNSGDDRQVVCLIVATDEEMTGSVKRTTTTRRKGTTTSTTATGAGD